MNQTLREQEVALLELTAKRRECRRSLVAWAIYNGFTPAKHHLMMIDCLERVVHGETSRLMFLVPPGSAKSTYASMLFPPWFLGQRPKNSILSCSYSFTLAEKFGKWCRNIIEQKQKVLGYGLSKHSQAAGDWETTTGGIYFCAGVGAGIAGRRADLGIIDDYLGSQEDADSDVIREKQWDWYWNDFMPRLKPSGAIVIIANRRHEDDLVGRLLEKEPGRWTVVRLPMLAEDDDPLGRERGERLWPEWYTEQMVLDAQTIPRTWAGLYQQRPAPEEGDFFRKDWIVEYRPADLPEDLRFYVGSDHALKLKQANDRTCLLPAGVDSSGRIWILPDWFWKRANTMDVVEAMLDLAARRRPIRWWAGSDHITGSIGPFLQKRAQERGVFIPLDEVVNQKDKSAKAQAIAGRMAMKMVMFPSYAPGWDEAKHELLTFPGGKHDDFVDALAELGRGIDQMTPASRRVLPSDLGLPDWRPTLGWIKKSHKQKTFEQRMREIDK